MFWYKKHKDEPMTVGLFWEFLWRLTLAAMALTWVLMRPTMWCIDKWYEIRTCVEGYLAGRRARKAEEEKEDFAD